MHLWRKWHTREVEDLLPVGDCGSDSHQMHSCSKHDKILKNVSSWEFFIFGEIMRLLRIAENNAKFASGLVDLKGLDTLSAETFAPIFYSSVTELFPGFPETRKITWDFIKHHKYPELKAIFNQKIKDLGIYRVSDFNRFFHIFKKDGMNDLFEKTSLSFNVERPLNSYLAEAEQGGKSPYFYYVVRVNLVNVYESLFSGEFNLDQIKFKLKKVFAHEFRHIVDFIYANAGHGKLDLMPTSEEEYFNSDTEMKSYAGDIAQSIFREHGYMVENHNILEDLKKYPAFNNLRLENKKKFMLRVYNELQKLMSIKD